MAGLNQHAGGGLQGGVIHHLDEPAQILAVPPGHFGQGAHDIRGRGHEFQFRVAAPGMAGLPQGVPEFAEAPVAQALGKTDDRTHAHLGPLGHGLDAPEGAQQGIGHQGVGDAPHRFGKLAVGLGKSGLDGRGDGLGFDDHCCQAA